MIYYLVFYKSAQISLYPVKIPHLPLAPAVDSLIFFHPPCPLVPI